MRVPGAPSGGRGAAGEHADGITDLAVFVGVPLTGIPPRVSVDVVAQPVFVSEVFSDGRTEGVPHHSGDAVVVSQVVLRGAKARRVVDASPGQLGVVPCVARGARPGYEEGIPFPVKAGRSSVGGGDAGGVAAPAGFLLTHWVVVLSLLGR